MHVMLQTDRPGPIAGVVCSPKDSAEVRRIAWDGADIVEDRYCPPGFAWAFTQDEWDRLNAEAK